MNILNIRYNNNFKLIHICTHTHTHTHTHTCYFPFTKIAAYAKTPEGTCLQLYRQAANIQTQIHLNSNLMHITKQITS